jgi:hypothetical protein
MVKDYLLGLMDENTLDSISMIKKKVKVMNHTEFYVAIQSTEEPHK